MEVEEVVVVVVEEEGGSGTSGDGSAVDRGEMLMSLRREGRGMEMGREGTGGGEGAARTREWSSKVVTH